MGYAEGCCTVETPYKPACLSVLSHITLHIPYMPPAPCTQTAATLHDQTQQLNKIVDDLNEIEFTVKKASKVIADITKGIMTDK